MADNTILNPGANGDTIRDIARTSNSPAKTQVVAFDLGGSSDSNAEVIIEAATYTGSSPAQPANDYYVPTLAPKDSSRNPVIFFMDFTAGVTTEALATFTTNKGGTTSSGTTYTVTTGKTLRIQSFTFGGYQTSTTAMIFRARIRAASTVSATSPVYGAGSAHTPAAAASEGDSISATYADGLEIAGGTEVGISVIANTTSCSVNFCVVGFEY